MIRTWLIFENVCCCNSQKDVHVPLSANGEVVDMAEHFSKLDGRLTEESLNKMRSYITACRLSEYSVTEELQTVG